jgi:hypothetical protein
MSEPKTKTTNSNPWRIDKKYPVQDWIYECSSNNTRLGYLDWVAHMKESNEQVESKA